MKISHHSKDHLHRDRDMLGTRGRSSWNCGAATEKVLLLVSSELKTSCHLNQDSSELILNNGKFHTATNGPGTIQDPGLDRSMPVP